MHKVLGSWYSLVLLVLIVGCFLPGFKALWEVYSSFWLLENALAAGVIILLFGLAIWKYGLKKSGDEEVFPGLSICLFFLSLCTAFLLNNYLGGFEVISPILAYSAIYCWLGFWLKPTFWKRGFFVLFLLILTLPILERLQKFIGFPLRLLTANIVSFLLEIMGVAHIPNSTVIMTENYATTIDLPCSGVKSIYFGSVILLAIYFLQQVRISLKSIGLAGLFFLLLIVFNIWRVFSLVYVYGVLHLIEAGDSVHVFLGVLGFIVSCFVLWQGSTYLKNESELSLLKSNKKTIVVPLSQRNTFTICIVMLLLTIFLTQTLIKTPRKNMTVTQESITFSLPQAQISEIPFSEKEKTLFFSTDVSYAAKHEVSWKQKQLSLLVVKSSSARTHHDPELCLQGLGYQLVNDETILLSGAHIKKLEIKTADDANSTTGIVYYWYVSADKTITDYSERVWEEIKKPDQNWVLVEIAVVKSQEPTNAELEELVNEVTSEVRKQVISLTSPTALTTQTSDSPGYSHQSGLRS